MFMKINVYLYIYRERVLACANFEVFTKAGSLVKFFCYYKLSFKKLFLKLVHFFKDCLGLFKKSPSAIFVYKTNPDPPAVTITS